MQYIDILIVLIRSQLKNWEIPWCRPSLISLVCYVT